MKELEIEENEFEMEIEIEHVQDNINTNENNNPGVISPSNNPGTTVSECPGVNKTGVLVKKIEGEYWK